MRKLFFISNLVLLITQGLSAQSETRFYAESNATEVAVGEPLKITFVVENGKNNNRFTPPDWEAAGFMLLGTSQSSNISIMNGQTKASATYHYTVTPMKEGILTIPAMSIQNGDTALQSQPITIQALPGADGSRPSNPKRTPDQPQDERRKHIKTIKM